MPLEVRDRHFLAGAVVDAPEHVDAIVVVLGAVQEASEGHRGQFDELKGLQVQDHGILGSRAIIVAAQDDDLIGGNEHSGFCFDGQRELDEEDGPAVVRHVVLLDRVDAPVALIPTEYVNVAVLEDHRRHSTPLLIEFCDAFPSVQVD